MFQRMMKKPMGVIWPLLKETFARWKKDRAPRLGAALSYYMIISLPPLLMVVMGITELFLDEETGRGAVLEQVSNVVGEKSAAAVQEMLTHADEPSTGIIGTIVGVVVLLIGASGVFGELQDALNTVWGVEAKPGGGILATIRSRFFSLVAVLGTGFLLLVSLVLSAWIAAAGKWLGQLLPGQEFLLQTADFVMSFGIITLLFAMMFKLLPDVTVKWNDVWVGAAATALLFTVGKLLIGLYLGKSDVGSVYGAAGSLVLLLVWVYYSAQILFFGAEFTAVYADQYGLRIRPTANAIPLTKETRPGGNMERKKPEKKPRAAG